MPLRTGESPACAPDGIAGPTIRRQHSARPGGVDQHELREAKATTFRRVLFARSCAMGGEDVVGEVKGVDELGVRVACRGARVEGIEGARLRLTRSDVAFAMICPTLLLRPLKKAAPLEKT